MKYVMALVLGFVALVAKGQEVPKPLATFGLNSQGKLAQKMEQVHLYRHVVKVMPGGFQVVDVAGNDGSILFSNKNEGRDPIGFGQGVGFIADMTRPDSLIGHFRQQLRDGSFQVQGSHVNGKREGKWVQYHSSGVLSDSGYYQAGVQVGKWGTYDSNGVLQFHSFFRNGKPDSVVVFHSNGNISVIMREQGDEKIVTCFDSTGRPILQPCVWAQNPEPINLNFVQGKVGYPTAAKGRGIQGIVVTRILVYQKTANILTTN